MATTPSRRTFTPDREQSLLRQGSSNYKGSGVGHVTYIGYLPANLSTTGVEQLYRDLLRFPVTWDPTAFQIVDAWVDFTPSTYQANPPPVYGASPRIDIFALRGTAGADSFTVVGGVALGNAYTDNNPDDTTNWAASEFVGRRVQVPTFTAPNAKPTRVHIPELIEDIAPTRMKRRDGTACGGQEHFGFAVRAHDETNGTNRWGYWTSHNTSTDVRPQLTIVYTTSTPPGAPEVQLLNGVAPDTSGTTTIGSRDGRTLTIEFVANTPGDTASLVHAEVYAAGAVADENDPTQPASGTLITSTNVAPTPTGQTNRYTVTLTNLRAREDQLYRLQVRNAAGVWGPYTPLAAGSIRTAYLPGKPLDPRMTSDASNPVVSATLDSPQVGTDPLEGVTGIRGTFIKVNPDGTTTNLWPDMDVLSIQYVAGVKRAVISRWGGVALNEGDTVRWRVQLRNRDLVWSPLSDEVVTTVHVLVGPTFTPPDTSTKLDSRTGPITISNAVEFDRLRVRLYRNDVLIHTTAVLPVGPATSVDWDIPAGLLNWGDTFGIEAEVQPTETGTFGPTSPRTLLYVNSLPTTTLTPTSAAGVSGAVIPTTDVIWRALYSDVDVARYGETPVAKLLEVRHAATPQGTGQLIDQRLGIAALKAIPEDEHSGFQVLPLTSATGWVGDTNVSTSTANVQPTDYTGNSLAITFASSSTDRGARYDFSPALDLSGFSSHAYGYLWDRLTSETNLTDIRLRLQDAAGAWVEWVIYSAAADSINTWSENFPFLGFPSATGGGSIDWSAITRMRINADVTGAFAATLYLRDLQSGFIVYDKTPPDPTYGIAFEQSYDARIRYRDHAATLVTTTTAAFAASNATNVKVTSVAGLLAGQEVTFEDDASQIQETRTIASVGTAGSGGTGITLSDALFYSHASGTTVRILPWGPWTAWRTVKVSRPPTVTLLTPTDGATVADAGQALSYAYSSPSGKRMVAATVRLYDRTTGVDQLIHEATDTTGGPVGSYEYLTPYLLLQDGHIYAWDVEVVDTDGLATTSSRFAFTASLPVPSAVTNLVAVADPVASTVTLGFTPAAGAAFHVVRWLDANGQWQRIDLGPRSAEERTP